MKFSTNCKKRGNDGSFRILSNRHMCPGSIKRRDKA
ncbi:unnamed protein product [Brassica oleracea var. botrytis]